MMRDLRSMEALVHRCCEQKEMICLVGAGGKTTIMMFLARECAAKGKTVLVSTTTHIMKPAENYAVTAEAARQLWREGRYAVIGTPVQTSPAVKLTVPEESLFRELADEADLILLEADGSKRLPCKVPAEHEPMIPTQCSMVIGVLGLSALGKPMGEICFRFSEWGGWLKVSEKAMMDADTAAKILSSEQGTRKNVGERPYLVMLNQCDDVEMKQQADRITRLLEQKKIPVIQTSFLKSGNVLT